MAKHKRCPECGVPEQITDERQWLNSGVVVQRGNVLQRTGFIETENLDPLYAGIAEIIGIPIDHLIVEITRKGGRRYVQKLIPPGTQDAIRNGTVKIELIIAYLLQTAEVCGYGRSELRELNLNMTADGLAYGAGDYVSFRVSDPYAIAPVCGVFTGACEAVTEMPFVVDYKETSPGVYEITASVGDHSDEAAGRLEVADYQHREGSIELEKCPSCGGPKALSGFEWQEGRDVITNTFTGRRMVFVGPFVMDPLFEELEGELGASIPRVVVEAQRRFVRTGFYSIAEFSDEGDLRTQLAIRGLGELKEMKMTPKGVRLRIDNVGCYLMIAGMAQALFEMAFGLESNVEWELSEEGNLELEVTPKK